VSSNLDKGIAFQIRATRDKRGWTQGELANATGMSSNNISRLESEDYGKQTITSLKRVAAALDVALIVRFVPFSQYIDWLSGVPYLDKGISAESLAVPSFGDEEKSGAYESERKHIPDQIDRFTPNVMVFGSSSGGIFVLPMKTVPIMGLVNMNSSFPIMFDQPIERPLNDEYAQSKTA
jgi:transcriptional regulator with XRE-family HTH domain